MTTENLSTIIAKLAHEVRHQPLNKDASENPETYLFTGNELGAFYLGAFKDGREAVKPRCANCSHWAMYLSVFPGTHEGQDVMDGGICRCPKLRSPKWVDAIDDFMPRQPDELVYTRDERGEFWTGEEFGCIHFDRRK